MMRTKCYTCGTQLNPSDPMRKYKNGHRYIGECKQCATARIVYNSWKKRSIKDIKSKIKQTEILLNIYQQALHFKEDK
jgi:hypothetical protein